VRSLGLMKLEEKRWSRVLWQRQKPWPGLRRRTEMRLSVNSTRSTRPIRQNHLTVALVGESSLKKYFINLDLSRGEAKRRTEVGRYSFPSQVDMPVPWMCTCPLPPWLTSCPVCPFHRLVRSHLWKERINSRS
jgi:hypothetical protein